MTILKFNLLLLNEAALRCTKSVVVVLLVNPVEQPNMTLNDYNKLRSSKLTQKLIFFLAFILIDCLCVCVS